MVKICRQLRQIFLTNGHIADRILLATRTSPELGAKGVTMFWGDLNSPAPGAARTLKVVPDVVVASASF